MSRRVAGDDQLAGPIARVLAGLAFDGQDAATGQLELSPCALIEVVTQPGGRREIVLFSEDAVQLYGYTEQEALGHDPSVLLGSSLSDQARQVAGEAVAQAGRWEGELTHRAKDGRELKVQVGARSRPDPDGHGQRQLLWIRDITRERTLLRRLADLAVVLELAPDSIYVRDMERRVTFWNRGAEQLFGFTREEMLGQDAAAVLQVEYPASREELERIIGETDSWEGDIVAVTKDGRRLTVSNSLAVLRDDAGGLTAICVMNRDVGDRLKLAADREAASAALERSRLAERLVRAQRLESLGQLAGGIAHDSNNILAVITGYASVIAADLAELRAATLDQQVPGLLADLQEIIEAANRGAGLTRQLLAFARQETVRHEPVSINKVVEDMLELLRRTVGGQVEIEAVLDPELPSVLVDAGQLGQVLVNLAVNSRDAMPDGGQLVVQTSRVEVTEEERRVQPELPVGPYVMLRVSDTGVGMTAEVLEHAFDPFYTTKGFSDGSGLGLATTYGIVTQAGGVAALYSEVGHGTTFTAKFPAIVGGAAPSESVADGDGPQERPNGHTVLIVDDQPALLEVTARQVRRGGYTVLTAPGGRAALELAGEHPIDLLLTDVVMPDMLGPELVERMRALRPGLPVIFASGFARPSLERAGRLLDGPLLQKPFSVTELLERIAQAVDAR